MTEEAKKEEDMNKNLKGTKTNVKIAKQATTTDGFESKDSDRNLDIKIRKENNKWKVVFLNRYEKVVKSETFNSKFIALRFFYWKKYPEVCINGMCTDSKNNHCEKRDDCKYWEDNQEEIEKRWPYYKDEINEEYDMFDEVEK